MSDSAAVTRYLSFSSVMDRTSLSRGTIYNEMNALRFPRPRRLTPNRIGWVEAEVEAWLGERSLSKEA